MSTTSTPKAALERNKLIKFVELLVYDYLHARKFEATGAKFAEECSKEIRGDDRSGAGKDDLEVVVDDADSWYHLAEKLSLPVSIRNNACCIVYRGSRQILFCLHYFDLHVEQTTVRGWWLYSRRMSENMAFECVKKLGK